MGTFSIWHWLVVAIVILLLFGGRNKLSSLMGDAARGITAFKKGLKEGNESEGKGRDEPPKPIEADSPVTVEASARKDKAANG